MQPIAQAQGVTEPASGRNVEARSPVLMARTSRLSYWMMILGTARLVTAVGDYGRDYLDLAAWWHFSLSEIGSFLREHPLAIVIGSGWPLFLGILLRRSLNRGFVIAAAVTFFILSLGGISNLVTAACFRTGSFTVWIGSFPVPRSALVQPTLAAGLRGMLGSAQLALELATACMAWRLARSWNDHRAADIAEKGTRRGLYGRLAVYFSVAFLFLNVRQPVWSAYLGMLNQSSVVRNFVLSNDVDRGSQAASFDRLTPAARRRFDFQMALSSAQRLAAGNHVTEAKGVYLRMIASEEQVRQEGRGNESSNRDLALALNNLAWMLCTCENPSMREPQQAVGLARRAVELADEEGSYWNTLGVACCRVGDWEGASKALQRSMELRGAGEGDSYDWFFLALIDASTNHRAEGREWYDRAVHWSQETRPGDVELFRFQTEAADALGLPRPAAPVATAQPRPAVRASRPALIHRRHRRA